jgi:hypothetical protein
MDDNKQGWDKIAEYEKKNKRKASAFKVGSGLIYVIIAGSSALIVFIFILFAILFG